MTGAAQVARPDRGSDLAYTQLRDRIVDLRLPPGAAINEQAIATELGLGRMPVHEGLARLAYERFVTVVPRRGTTVAAVDLRDVLDLFDAREALECGVVHLVARRASDDDLRRLARLVDRVDRARSYDDLLCRDHEVHAFLLDLVRNPVLQDVGARLLLHNLRICRAYAAGRPPPGNAAVRHDELLSALRARDADLAARAMRAHVTASRRLLQDAFAP